MPSKTTKSSLSFLVITLVITATCASCWARKTLPPFDLNNLPQAPAYAEEASWLHLPQDPAQYAVDIFWVYPTILHDDTHWLMDITDPNMKTAAQQTIVRQADVFTGQANLYAPLYRQINMAALSLPESERDVMAKVAQDDVEKALDYYLKHHNKGRPFILASHSQGSNILVDIVVEKWGNLGVEKQLVAAYLIGWSITQENLNRNKFLSMCETAKDTRCFIAYNTVAAGKQNVAPTIAKGSILVNPLSWEIGDAKAPATLNRGAVFFNQDGSSRTLPTFTSAQIQNDGLVVEPADISLVESNFSTFPKGVYHQFDYSLFYENLKANVAERIQVFLKTEQ